MILNRRQLLRIGGLAALALTFGGSAIYSEWWDTLPDEPYQRLSNQEASLVRAVSSVAFPSGDIISISPDQLSLDRYFDILLLSMPETQSKLLKLLLNALNSAPYLTLDKTFLMQSPEQQHEQLQTWLNHPQHLLRNAVTSLVILIGMGYTSHPKIAPHFAQFHLCGYGESK